ncbi:redox-regulated ATPase YchF [Anaeromyxobacter paludicola]|uniref:Ribosome-binding ATPase YchF n=1 Tax=Anaeromyxobacter paludicola TaxID=2918171 RepID=A0ABM7XCT4_9BACT|nr:redox-regulated ATPase YchF [Anaeromyxobacter paludicola]BDG09695.1 ribosome-binding ATPase YchF [Anaeromyxobacter paludicola]
MGLSIGIVGLPNVGKSTLFNALSGSAKAQAANYPFCTIDPNVGVVPVPDERLARLATVFKSKKLVPTTLEFVDIAGLVAGASKGEGLGNQFLSHIRQVDAVAHVLRCFVDPDVVHVGGKVDPRSDRDVVETELMLKDLESVEKRRERTQKNVKIPGKAGEQAKLELAVLEKVKAGLESGVPVRAQKLGEEERPVLGDMFLLTDKPVIYIANVDESQLARRDDPGIQAVKEMAEAEGAKAVVICGKVESELAELADAERKEFLESLGLAEPGLNALVRAGYEELGLITFLTAGPEESRAWTVKKGARAPQAAGVIHTDFEHGFIKAEVMGFEDLVTLGSEAAVKEKGLMRMEGKEYVVKDGDVMHFRFNV